MTGTELVAAAQAVVDAVGHDENASGGLLSRDTLRRVDELRIILLKVKKEQER